jgi:hypothetical protein
MHGAGITVVGGPVRSLTLDEPLQLAPDEVVSIHAPGGGPAAGPTGFASLNARAPTHGRREPAPATGA